MLKSDIDDSKLNDIEHIIETLDTQYLLGEPTVNPLTGKAVTDAEYDAMFGQNGSMRIILKQERPDSRIFKGVTAANVDFSKATKCIHNPPMTSISKADGSPVSKKSRLGIWMVSALDHLKVKTKHNRQSFSPSSGESLDDFEKRINEIIEEIGELKDSNGEPIFVMSLKHDGCAVALYYKNGKLVAAGNRPRDGINGASVLDHVRYVVGIPNSVLVKDFTGSIRGEIECKISDFETVNQIAKSAGKKTYENPRNSTAGAMNPLGEPKIAQERKLSFVAHSIENYDAATYKTARERAIWTNKQLKVPFVRVEPFRFSQLNKIEHEVREQLDYQIDGIIIEVNDLALGEDWGREGDKPTGDPRWKIAWKFAAEKATATIKSITWGVGKHGRITPVAVFDGVRLAGTTVTNCTIHNVGQLIDGNIGVGAIIRIYKAGDIIPYWEETVKAASKVEYPEKCPSCGKKTSLRKSSSATDLVCENTDDCPAQNIGRLVGYLSAFGVKGIAESTVGTLISSGLVSKYADFYRLDIRSLQKAGFTERESTLIVARINMIEQADKIKDNAELRKKVENLIDGGKKLPITFAKFVACLNIPGASKGTGTALASHFGTVDKLLSATVNDLTSIEDIGPKKAQTVYNWLNRNWADLNDLLKFVEIEQPKTGIFSGKTFCFSGSFVPDKEFWIQKVENQGAKVSSTPSKKTSYFVYGPGSGLKKEKAEQLVSDGHPVSIIEIEDLEKLLGINKVDDRAF